MNDIETTKIDCVEESQEIKNYKSLKIINAVLFSIAAVFVLGFMIDIVIQPQSVGTAFAIAIWIVISIPVLAIPLFFSLISLIVTIFKKKSSECSVGTVIYFAVFTVLPVITFLICALVIKIVF